MSTSKKATIHWNHLKDSPTSPALEAQIDHMFDQLIHKCSDITNMHVILNIDTTTTHTQRHTAEAKCRVLGKDIFAQANSNDMYESIKELGNNLKRQIIKRKETIKTPNEHNKYDHHHNNALLKLNHVKKKTKKTCEKENKENKEN